MLNPTSRREFLWLSFAALPIARVVQERPALPSRLVAVSEAGQFDQARWLVGALVLDDPLRHAREIRQLRLRTKYYRRLMPGSTDKFRVTFGEELIRYFLTTSGIRFVMRKTERVSADEFLEAYQRVVTAALGGTAGDVLLPFHRGPVDRERVIEALRSSASTAETVDLGDDAHRGPWILAEPRPPAPFRIAEADLFDLSHFLAGMTFGKSDPLRTFFEAEMKDAPAKAAKIARV